MLKVYLQLVKKTATRTFYTALLHSADGLTALWPLNTSEDNAKAAKAEGFFYASSDRVCDVAFTICADESGTLHSRIAANKVETILRNRGVDVTGLEVYLLLGREPQKLIG